MMPSSMAVNVATLSEKQLAELCHQLLLAKGFAEVERSTPRRGLDLIVRRDEEVWGIECKAATLERSLHETVLQLASVRQTLGAQYGITHLVVCTTIAVSRGFQEMCRGLDILVLDRTRLETWLDQQPAVARAFEDAHRPPDAWRAGTLRLSHLSLRDLCNIAELELDFDDAGAVLVLAGPNGAGKSVVLRAITVLLSWLLRRIISVNGKGYSFHERDVRLGERSGIAALVVQLNGREVQWNRTFGTGQRRADLSELSEPVRQIRAALESDSQTSLPLAVYYPVNRAVLDIPKRIRKKHDFSQLAAYEGALLAGNRDFRIFFEWFRQREDLENEYRVEDAAYRDRQLQAVRSAITALLPGFTNLRIQRKPLRMTVDKDGEEFAIEQLSDGEKCLLAMVGDLARRLAIANPYRDDPLNGSAVVLIDELELHLHPGWQRMVLPRLRQAFPGCQFIVTTHSPQVIASVERDSVKLIDRGRLLDQVPHTKGRDANSILSELMGVPRYPPEVDARLEELGQLIEDEKLDEARHYLEQWARERGDQDVEIVRTRAMIDFLEG